MWILFCAWTQVVCRQLGYNGTAIPLTNAVFGQGTGPIWMDYVGCNGSESSLDRCPFNGWGINYCGHYQDAGVVCQSKRRVSMVDISYMVFWLLCKYCTCVHLCSVAALQKRSTCSACDSELENKKEDLTFFLVPTNQRVLDTMLIYAQVWFTAGRMAR